MLVGQHVHLGLDGHGQPQELVPQGGRAEEGGPLGVGDLVAGDGGLGANGVGAELLEGNGIEIVGIFRRICTEKKCGN